MKYFIFTLLFAFCFSPTIFAQKAAPSVDASKYVGLKYTSGDKMPDGFEDEGGALLTAPDAAKVYGIAYLKKGNLRMLWLEYEYARTPDDRLPKWEVINSLLLPALGKNEQLIYGGICEQNGNSETGLSVIATFSRRTKTYTVKRAFRPNLKTLKIEEVPIKTVKCYYEEP